MNIIRICFKVRKGLNLVKSKRIRTEMELIPGVLHIQFDFNEETIFISFDIELCSQEEIECAIPYVVEEC